MIINGFMLFWGAARRPRKFLGILVRSHAAFLHFWSDLGLQNDNLTQFGWMVFGEIQRKIASRKNPQKNNVGRFAASNPQKNPQKKSGASRRDPQKKTSKRFFLRKYP